jgi:hypothetical protein
LFGMTDGWACGSFVYHGRVGFIEIKVPLKLPHTTSKIGVLLYQSNLEALDHSENRDLHEKLAMPNNHDSIMSDFS